MPKNKPSRRAAWHALRRFERENFLPKSTLKARRVTTDAVGFVGTAPNGQQYGWAYTRT